MVRRGLKDLNMVRKLMSSAKGSLEARKVKEEVETLGYGYAMSLYGVLTNKETSRSEYRRIEVLCKKSPHEIDVELIYRWFQKAHPLKTYSIWIYENEHKAMKKVFDTW